MHDDAAATSPRTPTMDAGKWLGGVENRSTKGISTTTSPGAAETMLMPNSRTNGSNARKAPGSANPIEPAMLNFPSSSVSVISQPDQAIGPCTLTNWYTKEC